MIDSGRFMVWIFFSLLATVVVAVIFAILIIAEKISLTQGLFAIPASAIISVIVYLWLWNDYRKDQQARDKAA